MTLKKMYNKEVSYTVHPVKDLERSLKFYDDTLEFTDKSVEEAKPFGWAELELPVTGARLGLSTPQEGDVTPVNVLNINCDDLEGVKVELENKKIKTTEIQDIPNMISMFTIQDPDENTITFIGSPRVTGQEN